MNVRQDDQDDQDDQDEHHGPGLLASPWFWIGGAVSVLIWIVIVHLIRRFF